MLIFQLTMGNLMVCEIERWGAVYRRERESSVWQARAGEALMAMIPNHKSIFTQQERTLSSSPVTASGRLAG